MAWFFIPPSGCLTVERFFDNTLSHLSDGLSVLTLPKTAPIGDFTTELRSQFILRNINLEIDLRMQPMTFPSSDSAFAERSEFAEAATEPQAIRPASDACTFS